MPTSPPSRNPIRSQQQKVTQNSSSDTNKNNFPFPSTKLTDTQQNMNTNSSEIRKYRNQYSKK